MTKWFLTVQFPAWYLKFRYELDAERTSRGKVDWESYDATMRPFFQTTSIQTAEELVRLFQREYGQPKATEARPCFAVVAEGALSTTDRVLHAEAVKHVADDAEMAHHRTDGPVYPKRIRGLLACWHDRATDWLRLLEEEPGGQPAAGEEAAQATALPERANVAYGQYEQAEKRLAEQDIDKPTDRQCYDWVKAHNDGDPLPAFETWQRYVREARRHLGEQKNTTRAGRQYGRSIVPAAELEPPEDDGAD